MGLDMRPMGKPKPGFEKRYLEIFEMVSQDKIPQQTFLDKLRGKKHATKDELLKEWFDGQITTYETIKAPRVGRDDEANEWIKNKYLETDKSVSELEFLNQHDGYYVIELAKERDGVPMYISLEQDRNVFRGKFMEDCIDLIGEDLVNEAWETKLADATLDYGERLLNIANKIASENNLQYLKDQVNPPESEEDSIESKLHIVFSLARWLIFYGKNGNGYEADF
ncbi:MAG: hypothetical protein ACKVTZ_13700 [Bacteroidia bacterium]